MKRTQRCTNYGSYIIATWKNWNVYGHLSLENVVCLIVRLFFGVRVQDANAPFRLMKTGVVKKYIGRFPKDYNIPNIIFTTYFVYYNEKVLFLPITFKPRQGGKNSINVKSIVKIGIKALGDFAAFRRGMKK